jgi:hypothetical protein
LGNPPFLGHHLQSSSQKADMESVFLGYKATGVLDYVAGWYIKAAQLIQNTKTKVAFVSTNSIVQGEQVGLLWNILINQFKIKIHFAHRTYCVIVGFANYDTNNKSIFEYEDIRGEAHELKAKNINPYLIDAKDLLIENKSIPICNVPKMVSGSMPTDDGNFIISSDEKDLFIQEEPNISKYIKPYIGAHDFLNNEKRYCFWLVDANPNEIKKSRIISNRVSLVNKFRSESKAESTRNYKYL